MFALDISWQSLCVLWLGYGQGKKDDKPACHDSPLIIPLYAHISAIYSFSDSDSVWINNRSCAISLVQLLRSPTLTRLVDFLSHRFKYVSTLVQFSMAGVAYTIGATTFGKFHPLGHHGQFRLLHLHTFAPSAEGLNSSRPAFSSGFLSWSYMKLLLKMSHQKIFRNLECQWNLMKSLQIYRIW